MNNILIIEDNAEINNLIKEALGRENYICTQAFSGTEGLLHIKTSDYSLIILDLMLPGISGEEFIQKALEIKDTPILVVSAKSSIESKIKLLGLGADDYLVKPFDIKELKARVSAILRRTVRDTKEKDNTFKNIKLKKELFDIEVKGNLLNLTKIEFKIMELLMENSNKVFTKEDIYEKAWGDYYMGEDKTINVHISNIRRKIKEYTEDEIIETILGIGFKLHTK